MAQTVTIGTGTSTQRYPLGTNSGYERSAAIYKASEIGNVGAINSIAWQCNTAGYDRPIKIYLANTTDTSLTSVTWSSITTGAILVYDNTLTPTTGWNIIDVSLLTPFSLATASNLLVLVETNVGGSGGSGTGSGSSGNACRYTSSSTRHEYWTKNTSPPTTETGTVTSSRPNLQIIFGSPTTCVKPSNLLISNVESTSATVSWTAPNSVPANGYQYYLNTTNTAPTVSTAATDSVNAGILTKNLSGLTANTTYYIWVRSSCSVTDKSIWSTVATFTTPCTAVTVPYLAPLAAVTTPAIPNCMSIQFISGNAWTTTNAPGYGFAGKTLRYTYNSNTAANSWVYTQGLDLTAGVAYRLSYRYGSAGYTEKMEVKYGTSNNASAMTTALADHPSITSSTPQNNVVDFMPPTTGVYYIGFRAYSASDQFYLFLDSVEVEESPSCLEPNTVDVANITSTSADINWAAPLIAPASGYQYYISTTNTAPTATTAPTDSVNAGILTKSISGLTANTTYYVWIRSSCSVTEKSDWSAVMSFKTLCGTYNLPFAENFDQSFPPDCWSRNVGWLGNPVTFANTNGNWSSSGVTSSSSTDKAAMINLYGTSRKDWLISPSIDLGTAADNQLEFDLSILKWSSTNFTIDSALGSDDTLSVLISLDNGLTWSNTNVLQSWTAANTPIPGGTHYIIPLTQTGLVKFAFYASAGTVNDDQDNRVLFNNFLVRETPSCAEPISLTVSNVGSVGATIDWTAPAVAPADGYEYYQSTSNTAPTAATAATGSVAAGVLTADLLSLTSNAVYYVWVRSVCAADMNSEWTSAAPFNTLQTPATIPYAEDFTSGGTDWTILNGTQVNKWFIGDASGNTGNSLYVTNDTGVSNAYTANSASTVQAYRDIVFPTSGTNTFNLSFDWKCIGEGFTSSFYDYFRVWLVPISFVPTPGTQISAGPGRLQMGGYFNNSSTWQTTGNFIVPDSFSGTTSRLVFEWRNDGSTAGQPPASIDNINITEITCSAPTGVTASGVLANTANITWTAPAFAPADGYEYYQNTTNTAPTPTTTPTGTVAAGVLTQPLTGLTPSTTYYVWVRSSCSASDKSAWSAGTFTTTQIPATIPYMEDFTSGGTQWDLFNGTQTNKWIVDAATGNAGNSLYITNDAGVTNAYTSGSTSTVQAYRDITFPTGGTNTFNLSFDWKCLGEGYSVNYYDYFRVWLVPTSYVPTAGTQITAGPGRLQIGGYFNNSSTWQNFGNFIVPDSFAGTTSRLIFEWKNDGSTAYQPPAAIDNINIIAIVPCAGTPTAGIITTVDTICSGIEFNLNGVAPSGISGLTYQWQESPSGANTWVDIVGGTTTVYALTTGIMAATDFRMIATCTNGNISDTSNEVTAEVRSPLECYCIPLSTSTTSSDVIANFELETINNNTAGNNTYGYSDYTSMSTDLTEGLTYTANVTSYSGSGDHGLAIWIDYNEDGHFDVSERLGFATDVAPSTVTPITFTVPIGTLAGNHRLRVAYRYNVDGDDVDPCVAVIHGETEDYTVNIIAACTDPIVNLGNDTAICIGESLTLDAGNAGLDFLWNDNSTDQTLDVTTAGAYSVTVTDGTCSTTDTINVSINPLPSADSINVGENGGCSFAFSGENIADATGYNWNFGDGSPNTDDATATHTYTSNDEYVVVLTLTNDCGTTTLTTTVNCSGVGIKEVDLGKDELKLYPNPTADNVTIENTSNLNMEYITVFNVLGQVVYQNTPQSANKHQLNVGKMASGLYTVRIKTNKGMVVRKFEILK